MPSNTPNQDSPFGRMVRVVITILIAAAAGWATWTINTDHPAAAVVLAVVATLTVTKLITDLLDRYTH